MPRGRYTRGRIGVFKGLNGKPRARYIARKRRRLLRRFNPQIGFPSSTYVKMRYVETFTISPVSTVLNEHLFLANGIFDPRVAVGGHQPLGHDQWATFYNKYVVYRSHCTVNFSCANNTSVPATLGIYMTSTLSSSATTCNELQEQGYSNNISVSPTTNGNAFTINRKLRMT